MIDWTTQKVPLVFYDITLLPTSLQDGFFSQGLNKPFWTCQKSMDIKVQSFLFASVLK